jgi:hypothetical protein
MDLFLNLFVGLGALAAAAYCLLLSRRLRSLSRLDGEVGSAIAILSKQVDALSAALLAAQGTSTRAEDTLRTTIARADDTIRKLEVLVAAADHAGFAPHPAAVHRTRRNRHETDFGGGQ